MLEFCQSKEIPVKPLFRMIWLAKDEYGAKLTPFSNNGQGDFEISGVDKAVSNSHQRQPVGLDSAQLCTHLPSPRHCSSQRFPAPGVADPF
jgi:hypothetical protein